MATFEMPNKLNLAQLPTPVQFLPRFSTRVSKFGPVRVYVKRDDLTHGPAAGNKIRKLEFLLAEAQAKGAKVVFTCGGIQSNHARATAILARQLGLECVLFLRGDDPGANYDANLLLDALVGAELRFVAQAEYDNIKKVFFDAGESYRKRDGVSPIFIPEGGSNDLGVMGYVAAFAEIAEQGRFDSVVVANGSGGTHAGLLLGRSLYDREETSVISFNVCRTSTEMGERVKWCALGAIQRNKLPISFMPADVQVVDGYVGPGYARATPELYSFIAEVAREDGLLLDPVYTGKALWGLYSELTASAQRAARFGREVLFVHTGGLPSIFAHADELSRAARKSGR